MILEKIGRERPESTSRFGRLGQVYSHLGIVHRTAGRTDLTLALSGGRVNLLERLSRERPADPSIRSNIAAVHY